MFVAFVNFESDKWRKELKSFRLLRFLLLAGSSFNSFNSVKRKDTKAIDFVLFSVFRGYNRAPNLTKKTNFECSLHSLILKAINGERN